MKILNRFSYLFNSSDEMLAKNKSNLFMWFNTKLTLTNNKYSFYIKWHSLNYKPHFTFTIYEENYLIVIHKKKFIRIFKDGKQIGYIKDLRDFYWVDNEQFEMKFSRNESKEILCSIINNNIIPIFGNNELLNYNTSNSISELKTFDNEWADNISASNIGLAKVGL